MLSVDFKLKVVDVGSVAGARQHRRKFHVPRYTPQSLEVTAVEASRRISDESRDIGPKRSLGSIKDTLTEATETRRRGNYLLEVHQVDLQLLNRHVLGALLPEAIAGPANHFGNFRWSLHLFSSNI